MFVSSVFSVDKRNQCEEDKDRREQYVQAAQDALPKDPISFCLAPTRSFSLVDVSFIVIKCAINAKSIALNYPRLFLHPSSRLFLYLFCVSNF